MSRRRRTGYNSYICAALLAAMAVAACGRPHDDTIAGVQVPIPSGMTRSPQHGVELGFPGFGGAQEAYQGELAAEDVVEFYKKQMPARGWEPAAGILSKGGMLSYTKEGKAIVFVVGSSGGRTALTIMVGGAP